MTDSQMAWNDSQGRRAPTLAHQAALEIRELILSGEIPPGQSLLLADTASRLGMSIMPVREALRRLEFEGLVEQLPQRGARVSPLRKEDAEDIYLARIAIECRAVLRATPNITEESYQQLLKHLHDYRDAYKTGNEGAGRQAHERFHFGLYALSGSNWIVHLIRLLWDNSERFRRMSVRHRGSIEERMREHFEILEACRCKDAIAASNLMAEHLSKTFSLLQEDVAKYADDTSPGGPAD